MPARRLSLTLLLVAPIISARRLSYEDLGLSRAVAWGDLAVQQSEPEEGWVGSTEPHDWDSSTEPNETYLDEYAEGFSDFGSWLRRKRALDSPGEDLETAEQVLFRPTFRYKHLVKEREKHHRLQEELRRQFTHNSPNSRVSVASLAQPSRKYYNTYPQQNQRYPAQLPTAQRVYSQQSSPQRVYPPQTSPSQSAYTPNTSPQRVYSSQPLVAQRVYTPQVSANPSSIIPKYSQITQSSPQIPTQYSQGFRQQRSPYVYFSQKRNFT